MKKLFLLLGLVVMFSGGCALINEDGQLPESAGDVPAESDDVMEINLENALEELDLVE